MELTTAATTLKNILRSDWGASIEKAARVSAIVVAYVITIVSIAMDCFYDLGRQTRQAMDARDEQILATVNFLSDLFNGTDMEFVEILEETFTGTPMLMASPGPIALLAPAKVAKRTRTRKAPAKRKSTGN